MKIIYAVVGLSIVYGPILYLISTDQLGSKAVFWPMVSTVCIFSGILFVRYCCRNIPEKPFTLKQKISNAILILTPCILLSMSGNEPRGFFNYSSEKSSDKQESSSIKKSLSDRLLLEKSVLPEIDKDNIFNDKLIKMTMDQFDEMLAIQKNKYGYYLSNVISSDYDGYDTATLEELGEQGDLQALDVLAWRYRTSHDLENAFRIYNKAVVFGSTAALHSISSLAFRKRRDRNASNEKQSRDGALTDLVYHKVALMRGDKSVLGMISATIEVHKLVLTENERLMIDSKAHQYYKSVITKRAERGLASFDNTNPLFMNDYYARMAEKSNMDSLDL